MIYFARCTVLRKLSINNHFSNTSDMSVTLFDPIKIGNIELRNRVIMAPLTRKRATRDNVPTPIMETYYRQRSGAGLIISEATNISEEAIGYHDTPGIFTGEQVNKWKKITGGVQDEGGQIYLQMWHTGRHSHPKLLPGGKWPLGPSAIGESGEVNTPEGHFPAVVPKAMTTEDIDRTVNDYRNAAQNALKAGFDGVEIHGANGYLPHQFLMQSSNHRDDEYGGSFANRFRFLRRIIEEVSDACGPEKTGLRLSPVFTRRDMEDPDNIELFEYVVKEVDDYNLAYLHLTEPMSKGPLVEQWTGRIAPHFRKFYNGKLMICGGYDHEKAQKVLAEGHADMVVFGRLFISNPDLVERFRKGLDLKPWDEDTFYEGGEKGYVDY